MKMEWWSGWSEMEKEKKETDSQKKTQDTWGQRML